MSENIVNKDLEEKSYVKIGNGSKPMVILPGLALKSTLTAASAIAENFKLFSDFSIYLFDDRSNIGADYTIRKRAEDVAAEMNNLGLKDALVYGASMGGMVGQYLAIDHPELVKKLFITSTFSRPPQESVQVLSTWRSLAEKGDIDTLVDMSLRQIYSEAVIEKYGDRFKGSCPEVTPKELENFINLINAILKVNTYDELDKIKCTIYVVCALGDKVLPAQCGMDIAKKTGCEIYIYGMEYGHGVYDEAPDHLRRMYEFFSR